MMDMRILFRGKIEVCEPKKKQNVNNYNECANKTKHTKFHPVYQFNTEMLPQCYQDEDLLCFVKTTADLTARINAKMTLRDLKNDNVRTGSGMITHVERYSEGDQNSPCTCHKCHFLDKPNNVVGEVLFSTSYELISDTYEAKNATFRLFYDTEESDFVIIDGHDIEPSLGKKEVKVRCKICNEDVFVKLNEKFIQWKNLTQKLCKDTKLHKFRFVIAHPHGSSKQIFLFDGEKDSGIQKIGKKSIENCPGTSGAFICTVNKKYLWT